MTGRVLIVAVVAALLAGAAAYVLQPDRGAPDDAPSQEAMATAVGSSVMEHLWRGHVPGRSAELMLVPKPHNFLVGEWDLASLGSDRPDTSTSHPNPWDYLTRVPIVLYGPGRIPSGERVADEVDISQVAPTFAELLGLASFEVDAEPLPGIEQKSGPCLRRPDLDPCVDRPKVIFTVVIDGGGWNALRQHPDAWPTIRRLMDEGMLYTNATIGSAPSITGALHATFGTGVYPIEHGIPGNQMRAPDGSNVDTWLQNADPRFLEAPTVSELWDEANANRPIVGTVSYEGWHLGMIGHGAQREGGDKDIAVLWEAVSPEDEPTNEWWINEEHYEFPDYLEPTDLPTLERYEAQLDLRDGIEDGAWFDNSIDEFLYDPDDPEGTALNRPSTPAFVRFTGDAVLQVLEREDVGSDALTDMFWVEMKMPDYTGHEFNMLYAEEEDVLRETDRQIERFVEYLDKTVGRGDYVFALSADHGQQPLPDLYGGWRINNKELERDIVRHFGDVIEKVTPVDIYLDAAALEEEGFSADEIARYVGAYTIGDNIPEGAPGAGRVPEGRLDERLFAGAFTTGFFEGLTPEDVEEFGCSDYPEGEFVVGQKCDEIAES